MASHTAKPERQLSQKAIVAGFILFYVCLAAWVPMTQDEAYYLQWSQRLAAGYFDHPPAVAWLAAASSWLPAPWWQGRLGALLLHAASLWLLWRFYQQVGLRGERLATAWLLTAGSAGALLCGLLITPDVVLLFAWILALHEAAVALNGHNWRWLTAGAAVGLGVQAKFTMLLMGPVFLWALIRHHPTPLRRWHPYTGGLIALMLITPNLWWNAEHDWITWRFQLRHGLGIKRSELVASFLPTARPAEPGSAAMDLASKFSKLPRELFTGTDDMFFGQEATAFSDPSVMDGWLKPLFATLERGSLRARLSNFSLGQLALWGLLGLVWLPQLALALWRRRRWTPAHPLLWAATWVPLGVFGLFALKSKVEANWAAMYLVAAGGLLAHHLALKARWVQRAVCLNALLLIGVATYARWPFIRINPGFDRILAETHGYKQLATLAHLEDGVALFADRYQLVAMLRHYNSRLAVGQWPGITRPSEFNRNPHHWNPPEFQTPGFKPKPFRLLTSQLIAPQLPGYQPDSMVLRLDCRQGYLKGLESWRDHDGRPCDVIHYWAEIHYTPSS